MDTILAEVFAARRVHGNRFARGARSLKDWRDRGTEMILVLFQIFSFWNTLFSCFLFATTLDCKDFCCLQRYHLHMMYNVLYIICFFESLLSVCIHCLDCICWASMALQCCKAFILNAAMRVPACISACILHVTPYHPIRKTVSSVALSHCRVVDGNLLDKIPSLAFTFLS